jgi:hypothetical protein
MIRISIGAITVKLISTLSLLGFISLEKNLVCFIDSIYNNTSDLASFYKQQFIINY